MDISDLQDSLAQTYTRQQSIKRLEVELSLLKREQETATSELLKALTSANPDICYEFMPGVGVTVLSSEGYHYALNFLRIEHAHILAPVQS